MHDDFEDEDEEERPPPAAPLTELEMVRLFAVKAQARLPELLKLRHTHYYDPAPGLDGATTLVNGSPVPLKLMRTSQPYSGMDRFATEEKVMGFVVNPGVLPIAKSIALAARGRSVLVTRKLALTGKERGALADLEGYGVRVMLRRGAGENESEVVWEWLFGVA